MARAYLRLDPAFFERKALDQKYPAGAVVALAGAFCNAEHQPQRGRFRNERVLRALLGPYAKWIPYLIAKRDLVRVGEQLYVDGWDEWQEGDWKVGERVRRIRERHGDADPGPTSGAQRTANWRLRTKVFERDSFTCRYCGLDDYPREWLILEHVDPGGPSDEANLVTACRSCNKLKGGRTPEAAGMILRDASPIDDVTHGGDASPNESGDVSHLLESVIDGGGGGDSPQPPASGGRPSRASGTNKRALEQADAERQQAESHARRARVQQRQLAAYRGAITDAELIAMNEADAPLEEIPDWIAHLTGLNTDANAGPTWKVDA